MNNELTTLSGHTLLFFKRGAQKQYTVCSPLLLCLQEPLH